MTREDCPPGAFACVDYACVPQRSCDEGCLAGESCDWVTGACVPPGTCVEDGSCGRDYMCSSRFDCVLVGMCGIYWEKIEQPISPQCTFASVHLYGWYGAPWAYSLYLDPRNGSHPELVAEAAWSYDAVTNTLTLIGDACTAVQNGAGTPVFAFLLSCED